MLANGLERGVSVPGMGKVGERVLVQFRCKNKVAVGFTVGMGTKEMNQSSVFSLPDSVTPKYDSSCHAEPNPPNVLIVTS